MTKTFKYTRKEVTALMKRIAKKEGVELHFHGVDGGYGGHNYAGSAGKEIYMAPFALAKAGDKLDGYKVTRDCDNPVEYMLIAFFHELSHCVLSKKVPSRIKGYSWNDTSRMQYELWITMLGIEYAHSKYGIKFSDQAVRWLLTENLTYIREKEDAKNPEGHGLICTKATNDSYTVLSQWEFQGKIHEG